MSIPRRQDHKLYVNADLKESTFGVAETANVTVQLLMGAGFVPFKQVPVKRTNMGMTTGTEGPNSQWVETIYHVGTLQWDMVYPNDLAWALGMALGGGVTPTQNSTTGQYEHDILEEATHLLPSCTIVDHVNESMYREYLGCMCSRLTFSAGIGGASMSMDVIAAGVAANSADGGSLLTDEPAIIGYTTLTAPTLTQAMGLYMGGTIEGSYDADVGVTNLTSGADYTAVARGYSITIDNALDIANMITFAGVNTIQRAQRGGPRSVTGSVTIEEVHNSVVLAYLDDDEPVAVEWNWDSNFVAGTAGDDYAAIIIVPDADFSDVQYAYGPSGILLATYPFTAFDKDTTHHHVTATVLNEVAAYLA